MLLAFDLDKTVLTNDYRLPTEIERAIHAARAAGHLVTVLTGRPPFLARPFVERLGVAADPHAVNHGVTVYGAGGGVLRHRPVRRADVRRILAPPYLPDDMPFACLAGDTMHLHDPDHARWAHLRNGGRAVARYDREAGIDADKIIFGSNGASARMRDALTGAFALTTYLWDDGHLEVTAEGSDKGAALALIAETLGVPRDETVAFGDGTNDVTMLAWAGHAVAVGPDATPEVRAHADEHVASPEELGVAAWLDARLA